MLEMAVRRIGLNARAHDHILIADLAVRKRSLPSTWRKRWSIEAWTAAIGVSLRLRLHTQASQAWRRMAWYMNRNRIAPHGGYLISPPLPSPTRKTPACEAC